MHRDIKEYEVDRVYVDFAHKHRGHVAQTQGCEGDWAVALHCPICNIWETYTIDNEAKREALRLKGGVEVGV